MYFLFVQDLSSLALKELREGYHFNAFADRGVLNLH